MSEQHPADQAADRLAVDLADGKAPSPFDLATVLTDLRDRAPRRRAEPETPAETPAAE